MALDGSPKKYAADIAAGLHHINQASLKKFTVDEIQKIQVGLQTVLQELRTEIVDSKDFQAAKDKGMKLGRINGAMRAIQMYLKEYRSFR